MRYLTWHEHLMLAATFLFALAAGSVNPFLGVVGLVITAGVARWAVVDANARTRPQSDLARRQREQLRAGVWR